MLFKLLLIGGLVFYLFRMITKPQLKQAENKKKINRQEHDDYVDYEELE